MGRGDWYRRTSWTAGDAEAFQLRLNRSRGDASKAQYLRIQALHLAQAGQHGPALELTDQLLRGYPGTSELAATHLQRAESYASLGQDAEAVRCFRASLAAQDSFPNVRTDVALSLAWFIAIKRYVGLYGDVEPLLQRYEREVGLSFPVQRFKCAVVRALLADEEGRRSEARCYAAEAQAAAGEQKSGLQHHPRMGLVDEIPADVANRLAAIGGE